MRIHLILALVAVVSVSTGCFWASPNLGLRNDKLHPCPETPNCVSSLNDLDSDQYVRPIRTRYGLEASRETILRVLRTEYSAEVIHTTPRYVHVTLTTTLGFVDDLEFLVQPERNLIHVRSASRVGYGDLGTNRERIETIRSYFD